MNPLFVPLMLCTVTGMVAAVALDPWGQKWQAALLFLVSASGFIYGLWSA